MGPISAQQTLPPGELGELHEMGHGERTLLLIPCMSCRSRAFDSFMERSSDKYTMLAVTLPGFGGSPLPNLPMNSGEPTWQRNAEAALTTLIDDRGLGTVTLIDDGSQGLSNTQTERFLR